MRAPQLAIWSAQEVLVARGEEIRAAAHAEWCTGAHSPTLILVDLQSLREHRDRLASLQEGGEPPKVLLWAKRAPDTLEELSAIDGIVDPDLSASELRLCLSRPSVPKRLWIDGGVIFPRIREVQRDQKVWRLTTLEARLLAYLGGRPGEMVEDSEILREVWGYHGAVQSRAVIHSVSRLRQKIERDPANPRHLLRDVASGYRFVPAAPEATPMALVPAPAADFFGREGEIERLEGFVTQHRLVSLVGPPGVGKTALVRRWLAQSRSAHRVQTMDLASSEEPSAVIQAFVELFGAGGEVEVVEALPDPSRIVLIEHADAMMDTVADVVQALWNRWPRSRWVVVARVPLKLTQETLFRVAPLSELSSIDLLKHSVSRYRPDYAFPEDSTLSTLVGVLSHLPLAIELVAPRIASFGVEDVLVRLQQPSSILTSTDRDRGPRHRSVFAALDSFWAVLSEPQRSVLAQSSVFREGFSYGAAAAVLVSPGAPLMDVLQELTEFGVLQVLESARGLRFRHLSLIRQYAWSKRGKDEDLRERFFRYYARFGTPERYFELTDGSQAEGPVSLDRPNFEHGLRWALACGRGDAAVGIAIACLVDRILAQQTTAAVRIASQVAGCEADPAARALLLMLTGIAENARFGALPSDAYERAVALAEGVSSTSLQAYCLASSAVFSIRTVEQRPASDRDVQRLERAYGLVKGADEAKIRPWIVARLALAYASRRERALALEMLGAADRELALVEGARLLDLALLNLSETAFILGEFARAIAYGERAVARFDRHSSSKAWVTAAHMLSTKYLKLGQLADAERLSADVAAFTAAHRFEAGAQYLTAMVGLARVYTAANRVDDATAVRTQAHEFALQYRPSALPWLESALSAPGGES